MDLEEAVYGALRYLTAFPHVGAKLFFRRDGFRPHGIMYRVELRYDDQYGDFRKWAIGRTFDGRRFEEPLDWKNPNTGRLESVVLDENGFFILSARRSDSIADDPDNFMWLATPAEALDLKKYQDAVVAERRTTGSLQVELDNVKQELVWARAEADAKGSEVNQQRAAVDTLSRQVSLLRYQVQEYLMRLHAAAGISIQVSASMDKLLTDARERGIDVVKAPAERAKDTMKLLKDLAETAEFVLPEKPEEIARELSAVRGRLDKLDKEVEILKKPPAVAP